jgi:hypothetical protein
VREVREVLKADACWSTRVWEALKRGLCGLCGWAQVAFHGFCPLFVLTSALMMTSCAVLGILGIVWSCTRGYAALVVLTLGLLGELMLFGGFVSCLLWLVLAVAVLYLYFVFLPSQYVEAEAGKQAPSWLQDLGSFEVSTDLDTVLTVSPPPPLLLSSSPPLLLLPSSPPSLRSALEPGMRARTHAHARAREYGKGEG